MRLRAMTEHEAPKGDDFDGPAAGERLVVAREVEERPTEAGGPDPSSATAVVAGPRAESTRQQPRSDECCVEDRDAEVDLVSGAGPPDKLDGGRWTDRVAVEVGSVKGR